MNIAGWDVVVASLYLGTALLQSIRTVQRTEVSRSLVAYLAVSALAAHGWKLAPYIAHLYRGYVVSSSSLYISTGLWLLATLTLFGFVQYRVRLALVWVYAVLAPAVLLLPWLTAAPQAWALSWHLLSAAVTCSVLGVAGLLACGLLWLDYKLRKKDTHGIADALPSMQTMERLLLYSLRVGWGLLSVVLATSAYLFWPGIMQGGWHKLLLSVGIWLGFALVLLGTQCWHWRGWPVTAAVLGGVLLALVVFALSMPMLAV